MVVTSSLAGALLAPREPETPRAVDVDADAPSPLPDDAFRTLVERFPAVAYIERPAGGDAYMSPQIELLTGYTVDEWMSRPDFWLEVTHPDDRERVLAEIARTDATGEAYATEYRYVHRDGHIVWIRNEAALTRDTDGRPLFWQGFILDITEQKRAEQQYRALVEQLPAITYITPLKELGGLAGTGVASYVSPQIETLLGYTADEWTRGGSLWSQRLHPDDRDRAQAADTDAYATGQPRHSEYRLLARDGRVVWVLDESVLVRDAGGVPQFWQGVLLDITDRREAEAALRDAEERYRTLVERSPAAVYTHEVRPDGARFTYIAPQIEQLTGYAPQHFVGPLDNLYAAMHPDDRDWVRAEGERTDLNGEPFRVEHRFVRPDGSIVWVHNEAVLVRVDADGAQHWLGFFVDITQQRQAEEALRDSERRYRTLVQSSSDLTTILDAEWQIRYESPSIVGILGYEPLNLAGRETESFIHPDDLAQMLAELELVRANHAEARVLEYRVRHADGSWRWLQSTARNLLDDEAVRGIVINSRDVTERRDAEAALRATEAQFRALVENSPAAAYTWVVKDGATTQYMSPQIEQLTGHPPAAWMGPMDVWSAIVHPDDRAHVRAEADRTDLTGEPYRVEHRCVTPDGRLVWLRNEAVLVHTDADGGQRWQGVMTDITARKALEEQLAHQALHDALTGLPNRALLHDRLQHALETAQRSGRQVAVCFLDIDNFKVVNDSLGHDAGDVLLCELASRLLRCLRGSDTVARLGGDEYAIVLAEITDLAQVVVAAERIIAELRVPLQLAGRAVVVTPSLGIALSQATDERPADLLRHADIAMYRAKAAGKDRFVIFEPGMHAQALQRLEQEHDLRRAIANDELVLHYQPKVTLADGTIHDVEALVRWNHPRLGLVQPSDFIPLAEETGLIVPLGLWVLRAACQQARHWNAQRAPGDALMVSVNLSARQFREPTLVVDVASVLADTGLAPELLRLEITESAAMDDADATITTLHALRALGVWLSIDDFGAGYSSLAYLQRYPVDALKIDRAFISALDAHGAGEAIVAAIVGLAHALGIRVVAEGLETALQLARLRALGCDRAQGFYFAPPLPAEDMSFAAFAVEQVTPRADR